MHGKNLSLTKVVKEKKNKFKISHAHKIKNLKILHMEKNDNIKYRKKKFEKSELFLG